MDELERLPDQPIDHSDNDWVLEDAELISKGGGLFGDPTTPPTIYYCSAHGEILSQDAVWKRDGQPYCPKCGSLLTQP